MRVETIRLYPTPAESQFQNGKPVPIRSFIAYLEQIVKRWPTDNEEAGAFVLVGSMEVHIPHTVTDAEIMVERLDDTRKTLDVLLSDYSIPDDVRERIKELRSRV